MTQYQNGKKHGLSFDKSGNRAPVVTVYNNDVPISMEVHLGERKHINDLRSSGGCVSTIIVFESPYQV